MTDEPTEAGLDVLTLLELENNRRFGLIVRNTERAADSLERIANAAETFTALFASLIGVGKTTCYGDNGAEFGPPVNFLRTGRGKHVFACDADNLPDDED